MILRCSEVLYTSVEKLSLNSILVKSVLNSSPREGVGAVKKGHSVGMRLSYFSLFLNAIHYECKSVSTLSFVICFLITCSSSMGAFIQLMQNKGLCVHICSVCSCLCKYTVWAEGGQ